jgi:cytochrome c
VIIYLSYLPDSDFLPTGGGRAEGASMSTFEWNKIIASVLTAMIVAMAAGILSSMLVRPKPLEQPAYQIATGEAATTPTEAAAAAPPKLDPIGPFMDKADPAKGQQIAKVCQQCHTFDKGGANKIGPNLFDVMQNPIASASGYTFSPALIALKADKWDPDKLNEWLYKPSAFAKGTKMTFPGLPKEQDRADVIAYLESLK